MTVLLRSDPFFPAVRSLSILRAASRGAIDQARAGAVCRRRPRDLGFSMSTCLQSAKRFLLAEDGPTAVEYAFLVLLVVLIFLTGITMVGQATSRPADMP